MFDTLFCEGGGHRIKGDIELGEEQCPSLVLKHNMEISIVILFHFLFFFIL